MLTLGTCAPTLQIMLGVFIWKGIDLPYPGAKSPCAARLSGEEGELSAALLPLQAGRGVHVDADDAPIRLLILLQ